MAVSWSPRIAASHAVAASREANGSGRTTVARDVGTGSGSAFSTARTRRPLNRRRSGAPSVVRTRTARDGPSGSTRTR